MPVTPEQEARMLRCSQIINARHGAAKPQNTVSAERAAAKLWKVGVALPLLPSVADGAAHLVEVTQSQCGCRDTASRRPSQMVTSCHRPRSLSSRSGL